MYRAHLKQLIPCEGFHSGQENRKISIEFRMGWPLMQTIAGGSWVVGRERVLSSSVSVRFAVQFVEVASKHKSLSCADEQIKSILRNKIPFHL